MEYLLCNACSVQLKDHASSFLYDEPEGVIKMLPGKPQIVLAYILIQTFRSSYPRSFKAAAIHDVRLPYMVGSYFPS